MSRNILFFLASIYYRLTALIIYSLGGIEAVNFYVRRIGYPITVLKLFGAKIGKETIIYPGITIHAANKDYSNLIVGNNCRIMRDCIIDLTDKFIMKNNSALGFRSVVLTHNDFHVANISLDEYTEGSKTVVLEEEVVVSANVVLLMGSWIGQHTIVGAGSVISGKIKDHVLILGNPARVFKNFERK